MQFVFNNFVLDCEQRVLWAQGQVVPLSPKVFDTLRLLVQAGGRIVTKKEFMDELWPDSFVEDGNLTQNIFILRKVLGTSADGRPYIETVPRRGYRFMGPIHNALGTVPSVDLPPLSDPPTADDPSSRSSAESLPSAELLPPASRRNLYLVTIASLILVTLVSGLSAVMRWRNQPRVGASLRLTNDGGRKDLSISRATLVTDGRDLFFTEEKEGRPILAQVSVNGGETSYTTVPAPNNHLVSLGPGGRFLLFGSDWQVLPAVPLLSRNLATGDFTSVFDLHAQDAVWSADGTKLAFSQPGKLFVRSRDGSISLIATVQGVIYWPRWSPDGKTIRFSENYEGYHDRLWQVDANGGNLHQLFTGQSDSNHVCCGSWTASGRSFVYLSIQANNNSIHVRPGVEGGWNLFAQEPIDIPAAPLDQWTAPVPSADGKHLYAIGEQLHGRLVRIDPLTRRTEPFIGGISAEGVAFSPDHADIVWTSYPEGTLWRSHSDGSARVQLSQAPLIARFPHWSPDGSAIVFVAARPGTDWRLYSVPANGGAITPILQESNGQGVATWSPDSKSLVFGHLVDGAKSRTSFFGIETLRLSDRKATFIPGSAGMWTARWSPDGRYISAVTIDNQTLKLYDMQTGTWTDLAHGSINDVAWSPDSTSLFFDAALGAEPVLYRVRLSDRKVETYATLNNFRRAGFFAPWLGVAPDGSPILLEDSSIQEVYSLAIDLR
jgi:DNA-binding winged helix-turn-helix (wHTH) protein/Tol biopolymer transport system component